MHIKSCSIINFPIKHGGFFPLNMVDFSHEKMVVFPIKNSDFPIRWWIQRTVSFQPIERMMMPNHGLACVSGGSAINQHYIYIYIYRYT